MTASAEGAPPGGGPPDEKRSGGTPAGRAVNDALRAFSKSARAFTLYDSKNEAIRRFLGEYREKMLAAIAAYGPIGLEVRPFTLALAGEVVYEEDDRERSLAFRLFRDGVRRITFGKKLEWEELLRLLEILSVRFTGVRQQEDDIVTLLRKAGFRGIVLESVEGFVPEEENPEERTKAGAGATEKAPGDDSGGDGLDFAEEVALPVAATDFDLPLPPAQTPVGFAYREVPAKYLAALQAEESQETLPERANRLCDGLLVMMGAAEEPLPLEAALPIFGEVRDFFLADRQLGPLATLVTTLREGETEGGDVFGKLLEPLGTEEALVSLLEAVPPEATVAPPELLALLEKVPGDHDANLLSVLGTGDERCRALARGIVAIRAKEKGVDLLGRIKEVPPAVGKELMAILLEAQPGRAVEIAKELCATGDPGAQLQVVGLLQKAPHGDPEATKLLQQLLQSSGEEVRIGAIHLFVSRKEPRAFDTLVKLLDARAPKGMGLAEAQALGEALVKLSEKTAVGLFTGWMRPKAGLLGRVVENKATRALHWAAACGLGVALTEEAEALLKELGGKSAPEDLRALCVDLVVKRRRGRPHG